MKAELQILAKQSPPSYQNNITEGMSLKFTGQRNFIFHSILTAILSTAALIFLTPIASAATESSGTIKERELIYIVRTDKPINKVDQHWEPSLSRLFYLFFRSKYPNAHVEEIQLPNLNILHEKISQLKMGEKLKGLVFVGHGNSDVFRMGENIYSGFHFGQNLIGLLNPQQISKNFFIYFNSCVSFHKATHRDGEPFPPLPPVPGSSEKNQIQDFGFETQLVYVLQNFLRESGQDIQSVDLVGHQGIAGFGEVVPPLLTDYLYKKMGIDAVPMFMPQIHATMKKQLRIAGAIGLSAAALALPLDFHLFAAAGLGLGAFSLGALQGFSYWHYISKIGRLIRIHKTEAKLDNKIWIRRALERAGAAEAQPCSWKLAQLGGASGGMEDYTPLQELRAALESGRISVPPQGF